jgi:hypothetical protein
MFTTNWKTSGLCINGLAVLHNYRTPNGIRTRAATLKGWCPRPLDDGGMDELSVGRALEIYHWLSRFPPWLSIPVMSIHLIGQLQPNPATSQDSHTAQGADRLGRLRPSQHQCLTHLYPARCQERDASY